nr:PREDICTED: O-acetyl-ADP-ribose deacetylase 1 isoform X1 [Latimeria chalumnae]|eukprot:XP_005995519.1 PREDICTED: O-acetyl-ADP-ribose deacetylase 1 isoform X1 [Latimeria chalumnae]
MCSPPPPPARTRRRNRRFRFPVEFLPPPPPVFVALLRFQIRSFFSANLSVDKLTLSSKNKMASSDKETAENSRIKHVNGDLFSCPETDALAHCISEDCRMGAGIAVLFKKKFGGVQELLDQKKSSGEVAVLKRDKRYIYYLITKKKASHKPTYDNLRYSLKAMREHCLHNGVTDISMPRIGCGLDRLEWEEVSAILAEIFEDTDINITVYTL